MKKTFRLIISTIAAIAVFSVTLGLSYQEYSSAKAPTPKHLTPPYLTHNSLWADSVFASMTLEEKVAQLFIISVHPTSEQNITHVDSIFDFFTPGGIIFFKAGPTQVANLVNHYQDKAKIPLITALDAEWGLAMRLDSTMYFPYQMTLGAIEDNRLIYQFGQEVARQCKTIGINTNFAPVVDVNSNKNNPVIGVRSFGQNPVNVAQKGYAYMAGLQDNNVLAVLKHFPGHGDTDKDSHKTLPVLNHSYSQMQKTDLVPFRYLINSGAGAVMVAHLYIPQLEDTPNLPATLSKNIVQGILFDTLDFKGLSITDAMDMKGVTKYFSPGESAIRALLAGQDIILMPENFEQAYYAVLNAVKTGEIPQELIDKKVKKILQAKAWLGLQDYKPVKTQNVNRQLHTQQAELLKRQLYENAITIVKNNNDLIPIKNLDKNKIAAVLIGDGKENIFSTRLQYYSQIDIFTINKKASRSRFEQLLKQVQNYDIVIVSVHKTYNRKTYNYGITGNTVWFSNKLAKKTQVILDLFAPPYALEQFGDLSDYTSIIISYEDVYLARDLSAQIIFGGIGARGKLPVETAGFRASTGIKTQKCRLKYTVAQELNINTEYLAQIDSIVNHAIAQGMMPGCQIVAVKDSAVFFNKTYGYYTYRKQTPVKNNTLYDIASITKVAATTLALMKLYDQGKFDVKKKLSFYLPELDTTNKKNIKIIDVLTHQARLKAWIPFYRHTMYHRHFKPGVYSSSKDSIHSVLVAQNLYMDKNYIDTIYKIIYQTDLYRRKRYKYSDLGFYMLKKIVEQQSGQSIDSFVTENFYKPLGLQYTLYNPLTKFPKSQIAPTENDRYFRHQLLQGYVHDDGAAMLGGVAGHAGLFSTANNLAILFQMLLQDGFYADRQYISPQTIELFTTKPFYNNRRALGFDSKWGNSHNSASPLASTESFGHTGFTGCMVWADPKYDFIFVFLSNRVFPDKTNNKLIKANIRPKIHTLLYKSLPEFNQKQSARNTTR